MQTRFTPPITGITAAIGSLFSSKVNEKDVAEMSFKALKLAHEISKDDTGMEETINDGFGELADAIKKSREALQD